MRSLVLFILFCTMAVSTQAQWSYKDRYKVKHFLYTSGDVIMGQSYGGNLGLSYVYNNKHTINVGFAATNKVGQPLPEEYLKSGEELISTSSNEAFQNFEDLHIMIGQIFYVNKKIRILLQGGPGISTHRNPIFEVTDHQYSHKMQTTKKLCLVVNPKLELPFCCSLGFSAGPLLVLNNYKNYFGVGIGLMYGITREKS
ncbi:hypothetical protein OU798_04900 [Prolixibacteraceae bacterium Z1-6]|uniref:Outer membrane protein beta-barrel domain-containing protein n=1 Tax=Draconibacterium aestuarii TaxID=2998507 RepID=A0A9X3J589_9BACT|nr:hypothetical protein [Prolixibacteraceae bacterium Z1-6]